MSDLRFLEPGDPELLRAWRVLAAKYGDPVCECPKTNETWQYMGTARRTDGTWEHQFRHRHLPSTGARVYEAVPEKPAPEAEPGDELLREIEKWSGADVPRAALRGVIWALAHDRELEDAFSQAVYQTRRRIHEEMSK